MALWGLRGALDILEKTIDAEVQEELARFSGNKLQRASADLLQRIRTDEGCFVYASMDSEETFECYTGHALCNPDGYPRLQ